MNKKVPLPTSSATNFYDLLTDIRNLVLEEPKRLDMDCWIDIPESPKWGDQQHNIYPACGMVGCIGGWAETLQELPMKHLCDLAFNADRQGDGYSEFYELCYPMTLLTQAETLAQTFPHAIATAEHIQQFQAKYESQLKATPITPKGAL